MSFIEGQRSYWTCDDCGNRTYLHLDFGTEWRALKAQGWRAERVSEGWRHSCADCRAEAAANAPSVLDRPMKVVR